MKDFFALVEDRRSVRAFEARPVEPGLVERVLRAAQRAPSAGNLQAYEVVVVRDPQTIRSLAALCYNQTFIAQAPVVLVFCADPARSAVKYGAKGESLYALQDATIAAAYAELAVAALGLATCWVGAFDESELARRLKLRPGLRPIALFPVGWPAEQPARTPRRPFEEVVHEYQP
ncbi:nitroreductase [Limisphaera ngatamarikiensis]|jgi:nitroreductase|uniref:Nitroreductase n=1 Tax=Limisphaera ngatamarikiensis TaxID=1324935 RepID=A0A6M1S299_9BACT|nr:nitroreductase family protein [Limisphaera ngatamarikiensis]NGO39500.1 nitroreductase [Limisphaera ngatamarikiensis]